VARGFGKVLEVLSETPVSTEPRECTLNHLAARQDSEALHIVAPLDDLHAQHRHLCHGSFNLPLLIVALHAETGLGRPFS
jgi:hypothetical protein